MKKKVISPADQPKEVDPQNDYETQNHLRTILDAHAILADPDKMKKVHALAGRHQKAIRSLKELKQVAQEKFAQKDTDSDGE